MITTHATSQNWLKKQYELCKLVLPQIKHQTTKQHSTWLTNVNKWLEFVSWRFGQKIDLEVYEDNKI
jgi:hypothetical protein